MNWYEELGLEAEDALWCPHCDLLYDARFWEMSQSHPVYVRHWKPERRHLQTVFCPECHAAFYAGDLLKATEEEDAEDDGA